MDKYVKAVVNGKILCEKVEVANNFFKRFMGLMYRKSLDDNQGLLLEPCNQIHTFGMKFPIDTITISRDNKVIYIDNQVEPGKVRPLVKNGKKVLELVSGTAKEFGLELGDEIEFKE